MLIILILILFLSLQLPKRNYAYRASPIKNTSNTLNNYGRNRKKPDWVTQEVLLIKAKSPELSCRLISLIFNHKFRHKSESVSKTFVNYTIRNHQYEIQQLRKQWKSRKPHKINFNDYWGMDITFVNNKPILGIIEHHSRKLIGLIPLSNKSSINIIKQLRQIFRFINKPKTIRVDNEACFNSKILKLFLKFMGIKHQSIEKYSPWQNGRVERLFGTFKSTIKKVEINHQDLPILCYDFQHWYNAIRPHQNLNGKTPEEIYWNQVRRLYRQ